MKRIDLSSISPSAGFLRVFGAQSINELSLIGLAIGKSQIIAICKNNNFIKLKSLNLRGCLALSFEEFSPLLDSAISKSLQTLDVQDTLLNQEQSFTMCLPLLSSLTHLNDGTITLTFTDIANEQAKVNLLPVFRKIQRLFYIQSLTVSCRNTKSASAVI